MGFLHGVHRHMQGAQHAQPQQVELDDPHGGAVVLVPLQDGAVLHTPPLDRYHLPEGPIGDHHATRMDAQMPREPVEPPADVIDQVGGQPCRQGFFERQLGRGVGVHVPGQAVGLSRGETEGLGHVPKHRPGPVGDHVGDHGRPLPPVPAVAVLDHLLPAFRFEVQVDVGRPAPFFGQEPFERQPQPEGVDPGETQAPAYRRIGSGATDLAHDVLGSGEVDDVPHHQEVARKAQPLDDVQFVFQPIYRFPVDGSGPPGGGIGLTSPSKGEMAQVVHLGGEALGKGEVG